MKESKEKSVHWVCAFWLNCDRRNGFCFCFFGHWLLCFLIWNME